MMGWEARNAMFKIVDRTGRAVDATRYANRREACALALLLGDMLGEFLTVEAA